MEKLKSRKLWMAIAAALVVFANNYFDLKLDMAEVLAIVSALLGYVLVEGANDITKTLKK